MNKTHIILLILISSWSCKETTSNKKIVTAAESIEISKQDTIVNDSISKTNKTPDLKHYEYYFVSAKSGLEYKDKPNGKVLGKFPLNTHLKVVEHTNHSRQVNDGIKNIKGEWLGVEKGTDTVYVFSAFLSDFYNYSDIKLFYASPYIKSYDETRPGFVNLSELYPFDYENNSNTIIQDEKLGQEPIRFNKNQSDKFFERIGISKKDSLYIFSFSNDSVYKFPVSEFKMIAFLNPYTHGDRNTKEYEYEIGLNLEDKFSDKGDNFAYVGTVNPFQTGKIKPLIWNRTDNNNFPLQESNIVNQKTTDNITLETYTISLSHFKYFIQSHIYYKNNQSRVQKHQLIVIDTTTNNIITKLYYSSSESINISPVYKSSDEKMEYYHSWTGELFKNKPPMIYGLYGNSFGCSTVDFIDKNEPSIRILCDNRH